MFPWFPPPASPPSSPRHSGASDVGFPQAHEAGGELALQPSPSIDLNNSSRPVLLNMPVPTLPIAYKRWKASIFDRSTGRHQRERKRKRRKAAELHGSSSQPRCTGPRKEPPRHGGIKSTRRLGISRTCCPLPKEINFGSLICISCRWLASILGNPSSSPKVGLEDRRGAKRAG